MNTWTTRWSIGESMITWTKIISRVVKSLQTLLVRAFGDFVAESFPTSHSRLVSCWPSTVTRYPTCGQLDRNRVAGNYDLAYYEVVIGWLPKWWSTQKFLVCEQPSFFSFRWEENHDRWPLFHICFLADVHRLGMRLSCDFTSTRVERPLVDLSVAWNGSFNMVVLKIGIC